MKKKKIECDGLIFGATLREPRSNQGYRSWMPPPSHIGILSLLEACLAVQAYPARCPPRWAHGEPGSCAPLSAKAAGRWKTGQRPNRPPITTGTPGVEMAAGLYADMGSKRRFLRGL